MKRRTPYRPDQGFALSRIERRRQELCITHEELAAASGISDRTYRRIRHAGRAFGRHIISLRFALRTIAQRRQAALKSFEVAEIDGDDRVRAAIVALRGIRAVLVATDIVEGDRRAIEIYLLVTMCGVNQSTAAQACGCTKQNINKLLKAVEDRRDAPHFDTALSRLETIMEGA